MGSQRRTSIAPPKYDDLFLHLATGRDGYVVHAFSSRGEATEPFVSPELDAGELPEKTGERLFEALFTGKALDLYKRMEENSLRLKLMIDPLDPALAPLQALPWELLRKPGTAVGLALSRRRSIVRHLWIPLPVTACRRPERLRILVVAASPRGRDPIDRETEIRNLKKALAPAGKIEIVEPIPSTREGMRQALLAQDCHVLHFIGHGGRSAFTGNGFLAFEKEDGTEDPVSGTDLVKKLAGFPVRLAMLNACVSMQVASSLVKEGLPAVVAMREPIYDDSAAAFSSAFYTRLAAGDPVDAAIVEGRQAAGEEWGIPVLFMRTPEGELFPAEDIDPPKPAPRPVVAWLTVAAAGILILIAIWLGCLWWLVSDGVVHLQSGRPAAARERFETALALAPWEAEIHADLAAATEQLGEGEEAEEHYRAAVRLQPGSPVHLFNLGHFLNERRQFQEAYKWLGRAAKILRKDSRRSPELDRDRVDTYGELARAALHSGGLTEAQDNLKAALAIDPDRAPLHRLLGEVALRQKNAGEAVGHLQAALDRYPRGERERIEARSLLVEAYDRLGDPSAICRAVEEFHADDPMGITPWALSVEGIAQRRSCPPRI